MRERRERRERREKRERRERRERREGEGRAKSEEGEKQLVRSSLAIPT